MTDRPNCIFCKIARGEIPSKKIYEDEEVMAFHDIRPQAPVHFLIIPKAHMPTLYDARGCAPPALGKMLALAGELARKAGATDGFRTIINTGRVGHQEVYHLHMHVLGGPEPLGPMLQSRREHRRREYGFAQHLALADRPGDRDADLRHQEAAQHGRGPRRRGARLQGRHARRRRQGGRRGMPPAPQVTGKTVEGEVKGKTEHKA